MLLHLSIPLHESGTMKECDSNRTTRGIFRYLQHARSLLHPSYLIAVITSAFHHHFHEDCFSMWFHPDCLPTFPPSFSLDPGSCLQTSYAARQVFTPVSHLTVFPSFSDIPTTIATQLIVIRGSITSSIVAWIVVGQHNYFTMQMPA